ncbi:MAG: ABC transporter permease [Planctomycetota bacterium]
MTTLLARRLIQLPLILAIVFVITFTLAWAVPGDPLQAPDGKKPSAEVQAAMRAQYNLDSRWAFAVNYLRDALTGDFGPSLQYPGQRVADIIGDALPVSATLGVTAIALALILGTTAGVLGALKPRSPLDAGSLGVALLGISLPSFVTGTLLLALGAGLTRQLAPDLTWLHLPLGGWTGPANLILPALALGLAPAAYIARLTRLGLADVMASDYLRTARAKGLSNRQALFRHALKNAFLPVLSFLGPATASAMTGSFVIEQVFNIPGLGEHFVNAVRNKDQFLLLGIVLVYAALLIAFNLLVDLAYAFVDPRISLD